MPLPDLPLHVPAVGCAVEHDCLVFAGQPLTRLVSRAGQTPFYVYARGLMSERVALLREALPDKLHIHYAVKANPMPAVVQHMSSLVDGLDVASAGEMQVALDAGTAATLISFAGPGKTDHDLEQAIAAGITINVESANELVRIDAFGAALGCTPRVAIRVNPDFELKTSGMKMGGGPKQFGIDAELVPDVLRRLAGMAVEFVGFHIFCGSQNLRPEAIEDAQRKSVNLAIQLAAHIEAPVRTLNIGGGFGIPYFPGDQPLDLDPIGTGLRALVKQVDAALPQATLIIELGRYLVGEAGLYVCRIIDRKESRGQVFLVTDGGLHHHLAASGNFGQVLRKNYPVLIGTRVFGDATETASVVGPLCTPLDLLADRMTLSRARVGDLVVVFQSGAYGRTASPSAFLSHPAPGEIVI